MFSRLLLYCGVSPLRLSPCHSTISTVSLWCPVGSIGAPACRCTTCQDTCALCRPIQCHRLRSDDGRTSLGRSKTRTSHSSSSAANDHLDGRSNRGFRKVRSDSLKRNRPVIHVARRSQSWPTDCAQEIPNVTSLCDNEVWVGPNGLTLTMLGRLLR